MNWKWRIYLTALAMIAAWVGVSLASRRFQTEVSLFKAELAVTNQLVMNVLKSNRVVNELNG